MEMSVALFVFLLIGAALVGFLLGGSVARWRNAHQSRVAGTGAERNAALQAELDDAVRTSRRELQARNRLRRDLDDAKAELTRLRAELAATAEELELASTKATIADREAADLKARFSDIVGLEAENTTLRVLAARIPELERRLAELEPEGPQVIDLREGSTPVAR